jgi:hypothetical protein
MKTFADSASPFASNPLSAPGEVPRRNPALEASPEGPAGPGGANLAAARRRLVWRLRLQHQAWLFAAQARLRGHGRLLVRRDSAILIDGYPRSGNTFAVAAFGLSQPMAGHVGRHLHAAGQFRRAARWGIPALLVLRDPVDAAASWIVRDPGLTPAAALAEYVRLHQELLPLRDHFVVAPFGELTSDFPAVLGRVNARFGTDFVLPTHDEAFERRVTDAVDAMERADWTGGDIRPTHVARPDARRAPALAQARAALAVPELARLREQAAGLRTILLDEGADPVA